MSEEIETGVSHIAYFRTDGGSSKLYTQEYVDDLQTKLQQKENIIKEVREDLDKQIEFCTNEANGTTNDKYCRIAINYLKHLKDKLDKGE